MTSGATRPADSRGVWLAFVTVVCWSVLPITLRFASRHVDPYTLTWYRFSFSALVLGAILAVRRGMPSMAALRAPKVLTLVVVATVGLVANYVLYLVSLSYVSPTVSHVVTQLAPLLLMFGGIVLFHERLNRRQWVGVVLILMGLLLFFNQRLGELTRFSGRVGVGTIILLAASVVWAAYGLAQKVLLRSFTSPQTLLVIYVGATIGLVAFTHPSEVVGLGGLELTMLALSCLNTLVAYGALAEALKHSGAARVGAVLAVVPLVTLLVTWVSNHVSPGFFESDTLNAATVAGAVVVTVGSALSAAK